jgi:hypothetical protein
VVDTGGRSRRAAALDHVRLKSIHNRCHHSDVTRGLVPRVPITAKIIGVAGTSPATNAEYVARYERYRF